MTIEASPAAPEFRAGASVAWLAVGTLIYFAAQYALTVVVFRVAGAAVAGDFGIALTTSALAYAVALYGVRNFQVSDLSHEFSDRSYVLSRVWSSIAAVLTVVAVVVLRPLLDAPFLLQQVALILAITAARVNEGFMDVLHGIMQRGHRMDRVGITLILRAIGSLVGFGAALALTRDVLLAALAMLVVTTLLLLAVEWPLTRPLWTRAPAGEDTTRGSWRLLVVAAPLLAAQLTYSWLLFVPREALLRIVGREELGGYVTIAAPALLVPLLFTYIYLPFLPRLAQLRDPRLVARRHRMVGGMALVGLVVGLVLWLGAALLGRWALILLNGPDVGRFVFLFGGVVLSVVVTGFVFMAQAVLTSLRRVRRTLVASLAAAAIIPMASQSAIQRFGSEGANVALIGTQLVQFVLLVAGYLLPDRRPRLS